MPAGFDCDVLVAGGGPAGVAAAIALAERGVDILVVDPGVANPAHSRCEMLPASANAILVRLGLDRVLEQSTALDGVISLWGSERPVNHAAAAPGLRAHGWSVDRAVLQAALCERVAQRDVDECRGRVDGVQGRPGEWIVSLGNGRHKRARYLIDATGRPAAVARRLGARSVFGPPLVARVWSVCEPVMPCLLAEAHPDGWSYALPRPAGGGSVGYLTTSMGRRFRRLSHDPIKPCGRLVPEPGGEPFPTPVDSRSMRLHPAAAPGWLATGDAAAAFDPVASQGLFNALSAGFFAGNAAADSLDRDQDAVDIYRTLIDRTAARTHRRIPRQYAVRPYKTEFWTRMSRRMELNEGEANASGGHEARMPDSVSAFSC